MVGPGHFERKRGRPCGVLGFLPFVLIPDYFSWWNLAKMNFKGNLSAVYSNRVSYL